MLTKPEIFYTKDKVTLKSNYVETGKNIRIKGLKIYKFIFGPNEKLLYERKYFIGTVFQFFRSKKGLQMFKFFSFMNN